MSTRATRSLARAASDGAQGKSRSYRLKGKEPATQGIRRIACGRAEKAAEELGEARTGSDFAASIHAARKDLKKLRAVLRLVRAELGKKVYRTENRRFRDAGRRLAQSRDAEVKRETLGALRERFDDEFPSDLAATWLAALERERNEIIEGVSGGDADSLIAEMIATVEAGREEISRWPLESDSWELVEAGLLQSYRRSRRAMKRTRSNPAPENVHEWRKRAKDLWYQLRILRDAWPPVITATAEQAHELADLLGDHHDLAVLADDLAAREINGDRDAAKDLIDRRQGELLKCAFEVGERLFAEKPKAFRSRFEAYWLAWRPA
ncbi:MAG TPA: CHAD domain-containing protein [Solirubrobacterales bacterium]